MIHNLPDGWEIKTLGDVVDKSSSNISLNKIKNDTGIYPLFKAKGFAQNISFYHQENEYLAIIKDGAGFGRVSKHQKKSSVVATMQYIIPKKNIEIGFVEYFLNKMDFKKYKTGSTIPHVYFKDYKKETFLIPPLSQQKAIVKKLDVCFKQISQAKTNLEQNLQNTKDLFKSTLNQIFQNPNDDWQVKTLGDVCEIKSGNSINAKIKEQKYSNIKNGMPYIATKDVSYSKIVNYENGITIPSKDLNIFRIANKGSSLICAEGGSAGRKIAILDKDVCFVNKLFALTPKSQYLDRYIFYWLQSNEFQNDFKSNLTGLIGGVSKAKFKIIKILIPPLSQQKAIVKKLDALSIQTKTLKQNYQNQLNYLEELKKSLLEKAFTGELT